MYKRRDINALNASDVQDYIHALGILRTRSAANTDDPAGYDSRMKAQRHAGRLESKGDLLFLSPAR